MIKRPALGMLIAFLLGLFSYENRLVFPVIIMVSGISFFVVILKKNNLLSVSDYILPAKKKYVWPFLLLFVLMYVTGYFRCFFYQQDTENGRRPYLILHDNKETKVTVIGVVSDLVLEKERYKLLLTDCSLKGFDEDIWRNAGGCYVYLDAESKSIDEEKNIVYARDLKAGQTIKVYGSFFLHDEASNPGQFDSFKYNMRYKSYAGISAKSFWLINDKVSNIKNIQLIIKNKIKDTLEYVYDERDAGVIYAMLTGEKSLLDTEVKDNYRKAGVSHILAISGLHITLICMGLFRLLRRIHCPVKVNYVVSGLFIGLYCVFTGGSVSAIRAAIMSITLILAYRTRHKYDLLSALCISAVITLLIFPLEYKDAGFLLSYTAMIGVFIGSELGADMLGGTVITLLTLPISLYFYYEFSPYGVLSNILILPLTGILLSGGLASVVLGFVFKPLGLLAGGITTLGLRIVEFITNRINMLPFSYVLIGKPRPWEICAYYVLVVGLFCCLSNYKLKKKQKNKICVALMYVASLVLILVPDKRDLLAFLDVGQGDCNVLIKDRECIIFDAGSTSIKEIGEYRLEPFLKYNGIGLVDTVTISHADEDHYSGILELLESMKPYYNDEFFKMDYDGNVGIKKLVLPKVKEKNESYKKLEALAYEKNVKVEYMEAGEAIRTSMSNTSITCLWPRDAEKSENETSMVFVAEIEDICVFFMGDIDKESEKKMIKDERLDKDFSCGTTILKVPHHGSKTSTSKELLEKIQPDIAVISYGFNNSYGHPHQITLDNLSETGCKLWQTGVDTAYILELK